jgi:polar amino acid transport system ATP-binding protein/glutamate/aspartate transport system ATP-binding protein
VKHLKNETYPMISLLNVSKWYGEHRVLTNCSASIGRGEVVVICGPSGSGKSTLIKTVNGLEPVQQGEIVVAGIAVAGIPVAGACANGMPMARTPSGTSTLTKKKPDLVKLRAQVGMVFQHFELFPHLNVRQNLMLAQMRVLHRSRDEAADKARALLQRVGMRAHEDKFPSQLSGGQQQRAAIARALSMDPVAMLFDEPTSALDPEMVNEVLDVMTALAQDGMTMLCVTHEMGFARRVANRIVFMDQGAIVEDEAKEAFFDRPRSARARDFLSRILH